MDENEFFRQATLRICGNLEIEEALFSCFHFLKQTIPVDRLLLQLYRIDRPRSCIEILSAVSGCRFVDQFVMEEYHVLVCDFYVNAFVDFVLDMRSCDHIYYLSRFS